MVDIFDEVDEELRAERAEKLLKKYGWVLFAGALLIVAAVAGWQGWQWWQARQDATAAGRFLVAMSATGNDPVRRQSAVTQFEALGASAPNGYRTLARLRAAALKADGSDPKGAAQLWDQVAGDGSADPLLRDLASLMWATHQIDSGDPGVLEARLNALANPDNAWKPLAQEQLAVLSLRQGKNDAAKELLRKLAQDTTAPNGVRERAEGLLAHLGS